MTDNGQKPTLAMYWAASCGGCEIAVLNIGEHILTVDQVFDLAFFPCLADFKTEDVKSYPDGHIDLCLFNGAIRNSENEEMAHLLRQKAKVLVAFGSCAYEGSIPALSNLTSREATLQTVFLDNPSLDNPDGLLPQTGFHAPEGELEIPEFYHTVKSLDQVVDVDYYNNGLLNRIEMAFRNYDPCMSCATHALPGQVPLEVIIRDAAGTEVKRLRQYVAQKRRHSR